MQVLLRCHDEECCRTLAVALERSGIEVARTPPPDAPWLSVVGGATEASFSSSHPPRAVLRLGNASSGEATERLLPTPFRLKDFVTVVEHMMALSLPETLISGASLMLDSLSRRLINEADGQNVLLTEKESDLLEALRRAGKTPLSREQALEEVWAYHPEADTHTLETHLSRLRAKLRELGGGVEIVTEEGGYRLGKTGG